MAEAHPPHLLGMYATAMTALLIIALLPIAKRAGLIDKPSGRKMHAQPTSLVGGLAMLITFIVIIAMAPLEHMISDKRLYFLVSLGLLMLFGLLDDYFQVSHRLSFAVQIIAVLIAAIGGMTQLSSLGDLLGYGPVWLGGASLAFTVFAVVGVINAINMADGVDGLAGCLALNSVLWMALLAHWSERPTLFVLLVVMAGVLLGFLLFNLRFPLIKQALVFMGNAGSLPLGFSLGWFAVEMAGQHHLPVYPITMVYVIGMPLLDSVRVIIERLLKGRSPFAADRLHLHHKLLDLGFTVNQTVAFKFLLSFVLAGVGVIGWHYGWTEFALFIGIIVIFFVYLVVVLCFMQPEQRFRGSRAR